MEIAMIRRGRMGTNMVRRLRRAGHPCVVHDVQQDTVMALAKEGCFGTSLFECFISRGEDDFADKVLSALREGLGDHEEKFAAQKVGV